MAEYNLGTARGRIVIDGSGAAAGVAQANAAVSGLSSGLQANQQVVRNSGKALLGIGVAAAAGLGVAVKAAADFESELSKFKSVTGETEEGLEQIRQKAMQIGRDTSFGAGQAAGAMVELGKAGVSTEDILDGVADSTIALAEAGELDLARAAEIATATMAQFNIKASDSGKVADLLAGTANAAQGSVEDLGMALRNAGPMAGTLGVSLEDTTTSLGLMAKNGLTGAKAGTAFMATLRQLNPQAKAAKDAMKDLGLITAEGANRFFDAEGNMKSLSEVSEILNESTKNLTAEQKQLALTQIFGSEGMAGAANLAKAGAEGFDEMAESIGKIDAADVAAEKLNNLKGSMTILKGTIETTLIGIGSPLQNMLKGVVDGVTQLINKFANLPQSFQKFIAIGLGVVAILGTLSGAFLILLSYLPKIANGIKLVRTALLPTIAPYLAIAAAIAAVVAGFILLYKHSEAFRNLVQGVVDWVKNLWSQLQNLVDVFKSGEDVGQGFAEILDNIFGNTGKLVGPLRTLYDSVANLWKNVQQFINLGRIMFDMIGSGVDPLQAIKVAFAGFLPVGVVQAAMNFVKFLQAAWPVLQAAVAGFLDFVTAEFVPLLVTTLQTLATIFKAVFDTVVAVVSVAVKIITGFWDRFGTHLISAAKGFLQTIFRFFKGTFDNVKQFIDAVLRIIKGIFDVFAGLFTGDWERLWGGVQQIFSGIWSAIHAFASQIIETIVAVFRIGFEALRTAIGAAMAAISQVWRFIWNSIATFANAIWDKIWSIISGFIGKVVDHISRTLSTIKGLWNSAWETVSSFLSDTWSTMVTTVSDKIKDVLQFFKDLPGNILSALGDVGTMLLDAGRKIVQGLVDGIKEMAGAPGRAMDSMVSGIRDRLPFSPAKEGPLKDNPPDEAGRVISQMVASGILGGVREAARAGDMLANAVAGAMEPAVASGALGGGARLPAHAGPQGASSSRGGITRADLAALLRDGALIQQTINGATEEEVTRGTKTALRQIATEWDL